MYDAGSTASLDNIAYGYDEEGIIAWDLPRTFNFTELGNPIASVIEKFSDFGQTITSKKYSGKTQKVRGHAIVFSNSPPIEQLLHRDIIHIDLSAPYEQADQQRYVADPPPPIIEENKAKHGSIPAHSGDSDSEEEEETGFYDDNDSDDNIIIKPNTLNTYFNTDIQLNDTVKVKKQIKSRGTLLNQIKQST